MSRAGGSGVGLTTITDARAVPGIGAPGGIKARIIGTLGEGVALVMPSRAMPVAGSERLGWWRIDLKAGEVIAEMDNGLHFTVGELLFSVAVITVAAASAIPLYYMLLDWVLVAGYEDNPWCAGLVEMRCFTFGPPPPGCYYEDNAEVGIGVYCN